MEQAPRRQAAISGRDYQPAYPPQRRTTQPTRTTWTQRPYRTAAGHRLLAFRITADSLVLVLMAGAAPRWVAAENVLSERSARCWLAASFGSAEVNFHGGAR